MPDVKWFDLHVHSNYSYDGKSSVKEIFDICRSKGIDGVAIVDHETVEGLKSAKDCAKESGVLFIPGFELKTNGGDIVALFVEEMPKGNEIAETADFVKEHGGLLVMPHPYRASSLWSNAGIHWDAMEGLNGRSNIAHTFKALRYARKHNLRKVAGSDAHIANDVGACRTGVETDDLETLRKKILAGDVTLKGLWSTIPNTFRSVRRRVSPKHE